LNVSIIFLSSFARAVDVLQEAFLGLKHRGTIKLHFGLHWQAGTVDQCLVVVIDIIPPRFLLRFDFLDALW
jgi:hypothetical protein